MTMTTASVTTFTFDQATLARRQLEDVADALRGVHKALVDAALVDHERIYGRVAGPGALLQLLTDDPAFAWLRPLSRRMALLDALLEDPELETPAVATMQRELLELFQPSEVEFAAAYYGWMQRSPEVVLSHGRLRGALDRLRAGLG